MKNLRAYVSTHRRMIIAGVLSLILFGSLLIYKLGSLIGGLSEQELQASSQILGWHGIFYDPLYLPLKFVRSVVYALAPNHGQTLTRLPNTVFGALATFSFVSLVRLWYGWRTALFAGLLFATSAWTLHVSRLASMDVLYLLAIPCLLLVHNLQRHFNSSLIAYGTIALWGLLLYVPGMLWLVLVSMIVQRQTLRATWKQDSRLWQKAALVGLSILWLPLLIYRLASNHHLLRTWLGLPPHLSSLHGLLKQFIAVPVHLLIRGPQYPELWLSRMPILDVLTLVLSCIGLYFYVRHRKNSRSKQLGIYFLIGWVLVALGGAVGLSLLVPLAYILAATGLTYLLHEWFTVFPTNPLARGLGVAMISVAVALSCLLNIRAYFVAWPHNQSSAAVFSYHR